eukprot:8372238-Ditylum_brightwellii.AAC.1
MLVDLILHDNGGVTRVKGRNEHVNLNVVDNNHLTLEWNYFLCHMNIPISGYVHEVLHKFQHLASPRKQYALHKWNVPKYGNHLQLIVQ